MTLVSAELGKKFGELRRGMESNKSADTSSTNRAEVRLVKDQCSEARVRSFTLVQDEPGPKRLFDTDRVRSNFKNLTVDTRITTKDPIQKVVGVANQTHRRCPVHATLNRATEMIFRLSVNGQNVPL